MAELIKTNSIPWHTTTTEETTARLSSSLENGLSNQEAKARLAQVGPNTLTEEKKEPFWEEFFEELREPMVLMLLVTGVLYAIWGELSDAVTIFIIILTLNTVEVVNEQRSKKAIASLRKLAEPNTFVQRNGHLQEIPVEQVVPGDLVLLQDGRRVPADARIVEAYGLSVDESALTGESLPVEKTADPIAAPDLPLAERRNMVYSSTLVSRGKGKAIVIGTGMNTEIGRIAGMARQVKEPRTPLQNLMEELSKVLVWFALGFSVLVPLIGIFLAHQPPKQMLLTGLSLAFATIPEELPIIITMVLALGAFRLSKKGAIARRLNGVEALGSVTVIATDKTGTLTENRMEVARFWPEDMKSRLLEIGVFSSDADAGSTAVAGNTTVADRTDFPSGAAGAVATAAVAANAVAADAVDAALLRAAQRAGIDVKAERHARPVLNEFTFDNARKRMSTISMRDGQLWAAVKGAPESILAQSTKIVHGETVTTLTTGERQAVLKMADQMAADGLRVLAFAERTLPAPHHDQEVVESDLTFTGLVGMQDPPRPEVAQAIATCRRAGVRIIMVTGDHPLTAKAIGQQIGLNGGQHSDIKAIGNNVVMTGPELDQLSDDALRQVVKQASIFARTTPEHKLRIVQALQANGERVAVTGDGVNDAPALSAADIGVAMGERGTDVAREAGAMVLTDDNFTTIVSAVEEGRLIYENLKKGVRYYLTCKVALILINLLPTLLLVPVPFAPVQIIVMELFMDLMAAASFVAEKAEGDLLDQKPRAPKARFMDRAMISSIFTSSFGLFAAVTGLYLFFWFSTRNVVTAQTVAFFAWLVGHVLLAYNMRSERQPISQLGLTTNRMMIIWAATIAAFLILVSVIPGAQHLMKISSLSARQWGAILLATLLGTSWLEVKKIITYKIRT